MQNRQRLIEDNINLVYSLVSKEYPTYLHDDDIIQSGMLGLCKAAERWDETKSKFSTYAWKCIRNEINQEFINRKPHSKNISLGTKVGEDGTLEDVLVGDEDVDFVDTATFCETLSNEELNIFNADQEGLTTEEISTKFRLSIGRVQKTLRIIKIKWRNFNAGN